MANSEIERVTFVSDMIEGMLKAGCDHSEICDSVAALADILDTVKEAGIDPAEFLKDAADKEAIVGQLANGVPWESIGSILGNVGSTLLNAGTNTAGRVIGTITDNALPAAIIAPVAAGAIGYGAGQLAGQVSDDASDRIDDIKHQELVAALRQSTERVKRKRQMYHD